MNANVQLSGVLAYRQAGVRHSLDHTKSNEPALPLKSLLDLYVMKDKSQKHKRGYGRIYSKNLADWRHSGGGAGKWTGCSSVSKSTMTYAD